MLLQRKPNLKDKPFLVLQKPSHKDLKSMKDMLAGGIMSCQSQRIGALCDLVNQHEQGLKVITTDAKKLSDAWEELFAAIVEEGSRRVTRYNAKNYNNVKEKFDAIDSADPIKKALLAVHTEDYVKEIISACVTAGGGNYELNQDVSINNGTFEVLIRDLATTIENFNKSQCLFSLGLPTHHAFTNEASGFCIFNKVAILIEYFKQPEVIICGLDVNADNGIRQVFEKSVIHAKKVLHLDCFDSRVYPCQKLTALKKKQFDVSKGLDTDYQYVPFDLSSNARRQHKIHPVILVILEQIQKRVFAAKSGVAIYLALGWDSHVEETADCGKKISDNEFLNAAESKQTRFNDADFEHFYQQLSQMMKDKKVTIYIGLEGGYTPEVNAKQLKIVINTFCKKDHQLNKENLVEDQKSDNKNKIEEQKISSNHHKKRSRTKDVALNEIKVQISDEEVTDGKTLKKLKTEKSFSERDTQTDSNPDTMQKAPTAFFKTKKEEDKKLKPVYCLRSRVVFGKNLNH